METDSSSHHIHQAAIYTNPFYSSYIPINLPGLITHSILRPNIQWPINPMTHISLELGRKLEHTEETGQSQGEHAHCTSTAQEVRIVPGSQEMSFLLSAPHLLNSVIYLFIYSQFGNPKPRKYHLVAKCESQTRYDYVPPQNKIS